MASKKKNKKNSKYRRRKKASWDVNPIVGVVGKSSGLAIVKTIRSRPTAPQPVGLFMARYAAKCKTCNELIAIGDWVSKSRVKGVVYPRCICKDRENFVG